MLARHLLLISLAAASAGCHSDITPPGARGTTVPRHVKPASYGRSDIPRTPMRTHHVLEVRDGCGNTCDFRQTAESSLVMHLRDNGEASAEDSGELVEQVSSSLGSSAQQTKWTRKWTGSWSEGDQVLEVVLEPDEVGCTRTTEKGDVDKDCAERRDLRLRCRLVHLDLVRPRDAGARAWACRARGFRNITSITPLPWVFGISDSVVVLDGGNSHEPTRRYALEKPQAP